MKQKEEDFEIRVREYTNNLIKKITYKLYSDYLARDNCFLFNSFNLDYETGELSINLQLMLQTEKTLEIKSTAAGQISHASINKISNKMRTFYTLFSNFYEQCIFEFTLKRIVFVKSLNVNLRSYMDNDNKGDILFQRKYDFSSKKDINLF